MYTCKRAIEKLIRVPNICKRDLHKRVQHECTCTEMTSEYERCVYLQKSNKDIRVPKICKRDLHKTLINVLIALLRVYTAHTFAKETYIKEPKICKRDLHKTLINVLIARAIQTLTRVLPPSHTQKHTHPLFLCVTHSHRWG